MKKQRFLALFLAVMMIFSSFLPQTAIAFADTSAESPAASSSDEGVTTTSGAGTVVTPPDGEGGVGDIFEKDFIRVRIEGTNQTLYDDEVEIDLDTNITPLDVLKLAIGEDNIGGSTGSYGYFISSLMSEDQSDQLYWMYKTVDLSDHFQTIWDSVDSHTGLVNDDGELQVNELVFYKSYYKELSSSNIMQTVAPRVTESNEGHVFTFTLVNDETPSEVIEGAVFTLEDGSEYTTSVDGTVEIPLTTAGEQYIKIAKVYHDDDLALDAPLLIRDTISVTSEGSSIVTDTIHLRIEGASETLYDKDLEIALSQDINPKDILIQAIGEDQIEATTTNGYFITGLLGESQQDNLGWSYGVVTNSDNFIYPTVGVDQYDALLDAEGRLQVKELIFYITYYDSTTLYTKMPIITIENDQENFTVTIKSHDAGTPAIEDVTIAISDGRKYNTNALGQATFNLNQASDYTLYIEKYLENETTGQEYPYIIRQTCIVTSPGKNDASVSTAVADILNYYKDKDALTCTEVLAYNHLQTNTSEYITVFKKNDSTNHAGLADNIIGSIATGQDASSYIKALLDAQQEDGSFIVDGEATSSTNLANVILALDMSSASYNVDQAVNKLLSYESDGYFDDVSSTALVLLALASHSESEAVQTVIDSSLDYLAQQQLANGGFDGFDYGNSPYTTGPVIQALVRLEQDFDDSTWKKETRSIIEALLACKIEGNGYDFVEGWNYGDPTATAYAFAALSDYAIGISAYDDFKLPDSSSEIELALKSVINDITLYLNALETRRDSNWVEHPAFFRPLETVALNVSNSDIDSVVDAIAEKFDLNVSEGTLPYAMNIIGLIATGQNADYYVDLLVNNQLNDGSFKVGVVEQTEWAMIALDMANAVYDTEKAVAYILTDNQDEESVALLAPALIALSNHTDIDGVTAFIDDKISYIHTQQLNTGGFETITGYGEDSVATALIVSALIANGINPLKDSNWIKDGKTLFDVLMSYKKLNYFIYNDMYGEYMYKDEATEQVFIAMVDLLNQRSSFSTVQPCKSLNAIAISAYDKVENHLLTSDTRINDSNASENMFYTSYDALALNAGSADKKSLYTQLQTNVIFKGDDSLESLAMNVIASIASGKVLTLTDEKYHEVLMAKQDANGIFSNSLIAQSQAIIALDMADVIYNKTGALQALSQMINDNDSKTVEEICWAIIALSRYQDDSNYEIILDGLVKDLSDAQQNDAGFGDAAKNGLALQALISIGEKATSETWKKGSNSIIEKLIDSQLDDSTFKLDGSTSDSYATGMAILGLVSQITGTSPYLEVTPELDPKDIYKNHIKDLHDYYDQVAQLNYIQASGLYMTNGVKSTLLSKLESRSNEAKRTYIVFDNDVEMIAKDIIGLVGLDENPYAFNGQNFVQTLIATMNEDGVFVKEDTADISSQAYAIIALDMANLDYDTEKAIHQLIELYNTKSQQGKLSVYNVAEAMIALSNHTEMTNVPEAINICKTDLKKMQMSTGGYDYSDGSSSNASEVSEYDAIAIQAIIAVGDDPSSDTYTIDGKNPIDGLLSFKRDKHFIYDESKLSYQVYHESCSGYALAALIDLDNKDSMYHKKHILTPTDQVTTDLDAYWPSYRKNKSNMALLNVELPRKQKEAIEAWKKKLAISWTSGAISTPLIVDDKVYVVCGKTLSVFDKDGNELNTMTLEGSTGYYANFLASGKGLIYAHIGNGKIQAVDAKTLESKWISTIGDGYNTLSPILYEDGYIYTGSGP
ncbi:MAG: hypothetical protein JXO44_00990, partial [Clostridia bacterium]|nr:hypothetical protein [Clostridia bacterium]